ncbi:hypothetical protein FNF29_00620 [Cafeteria roenbergensis]|uniref:SURF1-like protein n=1 Tax=Cafeteria roenbergensis TaxID=33653 RepID=A0A5A8CWY2_CAFRO|nr:hypothetical protein FNF29_00620 [Cafeteria roenbergensis]|eukprot:KAA0157268.1 hypothetical protein FNF29_00620 [Cafeteria roenbergensis]
MLGPSVVGRGARGLATAAKAAGGGAGRATGLAAFGSLCAATFGLGVWQTLRYFEKYEMTEKRVEQLEDEPVALWDLVGSLPAQLKSGDVPARRVTVSGKFDTDRTLLIGPRPPPKDFPREMMGADTAGFLVVTVFVDDDGREVLVHRGWVPRSKASGAPYDSMQARARGHRSVEGVLRGSERMGNSIGASASSDQILMLDIQAVGDALSLKDSADVDARAAMVEQIRPLDRSDLPFTKQLDAFRNFFTTPTTHITYAATWYTLAIIGAILTRRMFAPSRSSRVHDAVSDYMVRQDNARHTRKAGSVLMAVLGAGTYAGARAPAPRQREPLTGPALTASVLVPCRPTAEAGTHAAPADAPTARA